MPPTLAWSPSRAPATSTSTWAVSSVLAAGDCLTGGTFCIHCGAGVQSVTVDDRRAKSQPGRDRTVIRISYRSGRGAVGIRRFLPSTPPDSSRG